MVTTTTGLATSFINFSRTSNATVTDRDGKIKWAGHNLLTNSESFDASAWVKVGVGISANTAAAPNGTTTADTISWGAGGTVYMQQDISFAVGTVLTFSVWVRSASGSQTFRLYGDNTISSSDFTATTTWQLFTHTYTVATGGSGRGCGIGSASGTSFSGFIWGASLYRSDLGGMVFNPAMPAGMGTYYPTTPRNLLGYTEDFSNAAWLTFQASTNSNVAVSPNGITNADKIIISSGFSSGVVYQTYSGAIAGSVYAWSIYIKAAEFFSAQLQIVARNGSTEIGRNIVTINLATGTITDSSSGTSFSSGASSVASAGNGWYRVAFKGTSPASTNRIDLAAGIVGSGNGTSGVYVWGAQLSDSASIDPYTPVYGAAVTSAAYYAPRLDYSPTTIQPLGLLVEEQRSNIVPYSETFDNAAWVKTDVTIVANGAEAPSGALAADAVVEGSGTVSPNLTQAASLAVKGVQSFYVKPNGRTWVYMQVSMAGGTPPALANRRVWFNLSGTGSVGTVGSAYSSAAVTSLSNGWYRISAAVDPAATGSSVTFTVIGITTADQGTFYTGDGTSGIYIWGAQLEAGSFATSYIPTGASQVTRSPDVASVSTQAFPYSATEGTWVAAFQTLFSGTAFGTSVILSNEADVNKRLLFIATSQDTATSRDASTSVVATGDITGSVSKSASAYTASERAVVSNGGTVATGTVSAAYSTSSYVTIGALGSSFGLNGYIRQITYLPRRISNAELQTRTA